MNEAIVTHKLNEDWVKTELSAIIKRIVLETIAEQIKPGGILNK